MHITTESHKLRKPKFYVKKEMISCLFFSYFSQLSDCGQKLGTEVRLSYHELVLMLVEAVQGFSSLNEK